MADSDRSRIRLQWEIAGGLFFHPDQWGSILRLARAYGWEPAGTEAPPGWRGKPWTGLYEPACEQRVPAEDARQLSLSLSRALDMFRTGELRHEDLLEGVKLIVGTPEANQRILAFMDACLQGGFVLFGPVDIEV